MEELHDLVKQAQQGDLDAFDILVRRFQDMAVGYAYSQLNDFHLAQDTAQEAFIGAYLNLSKLQEPITFPRWFRKVIYTHCNRLMRKKRVPTVELDYAAGVATKEKGPDTILDEQDLKDRVTAAIQTLPKRDRTVITLFYISQLSQKEIASFLDMSLTTVNNRLHHAKKRLKKELITVAQENLQTQRPSKDDVFATEIQRDLESLKTLHNKFATVLKDVISSVLETDVTVKILSANQSTYDQFLQSLPSPSLTLHFKMEPTDGRISFDFSPTLALALRGHLSGSNTLDWTPEDWPRLKPIARDIMKNLEEIWGNVPGVAMSDGEWETNVVGLSNYPKLWNDRSRHLFGDVKDAPIDPVVHIQLALESQDLFCTLNLCYPACTLKSVLPHLHN